MDRDEHDTERPELDDVDEAILHLLQGDARLSMTEMADALPVSANTVRNRILALEAAGVITDSLVDVDYARTPYPILYHFTCTVSIGERESLADEALEIPGVIGVTELMTGRRNLLVRAVGRNQDDLTAIAQVLDDRGIEVVDETLIKRNARRPLSYFDTAPTDTS
jgi:DNA-binding Lrp family transcriptional regulator